MHFCLMFKNTNSLKKVCKGNKKKEEVMAEYNQSFTIHNK